MTTTDKLYRVLVTDWEAEHSLEVWCHTLEDAVHVAKRLRERDCSVQVNYPAGDSRKPVVIA